MLEVGLQEFVAYGIAQKAQIVKDGFVILSKVPKIDSVTGILVCTFFLFKAFYKSKHEFLGSSWKYP